MRQGQNRKRNGGFFYSNWAQKGSETVKRRSSGGGYKKEEGVWKRARENGSTFY